VIFAPTALLSVSVALFSQDWILLLCNFGALAKRARRDAAAQRGRGACNGADAARACGGRNAGPLTMAARTRRTGAIPDRVTLRRMSICKID
jgi:hypothetical protein